MMVRICVVLLALMLGACRSNELKVSDEVSAGGLPFSLIEMPNNKRISVQIAWPSHWAYEQNKNQAVPYIGTRLLLAGGAEGFPAGAVVERFADMKSEGYLTPSVDHIFGTLHFSPEQQEETLKLANAHLRAPALDSRWFERIRDEFADQMQEVRSKADAKGFEAMRWAVFGQQPIRAALSLDEAKMVEGVTQPDVSAWVKTVITRSGVTVVVAGDLSAEHAGGVIDALFEGLPEGGLANKAPVEADFSAKRIVLHVPDAKTSTLSFIGKLPPTREGSEFEDILLANALGGGSQSVLFEAVRSNLRATYGYGAGMQGFSRDHRVLVLTGQVETSKIGEAEKVIRQAYATFRSEGPSSDLQSRKEPFQENINESLKDTGTVAYTAMMAKLDGQKENRLLALPDELKAVTEESLKQRLHVAFPAADDFIVVVSTPDEHALDDACIIIQPAQAADC